MRKTELSDNANQEREKQPGRHGGFKRLGG